MYDPYMPLQQLYMGRKTVRGIWCDWWRSCMYWNMTKTTNNYTLDYFWTANDTSYQWTTSDSSHVVPVRAEVQGMSYPKDGTPQSLFHHTYDYFDFRHNIWAPDDKFLVTFPLCILNGKFR